MTNRRNSLCELVTKLVASQIETLLNTFSDKLAEKFNENERKIEELKKTINEKTINDKRMDLVENRVSEQEYNMRDVIEAHIKIIQMIENLEKQRIEENQQVLHLLTDIKNGIQSNQQVGIEN